jgi:hypothetical protein
MLLKTRLTYSPTMPRTFKEKLLSDDFLVTAEITPPKGTDLSEALEDAEIIKGLIDAAGRHENEPSGGQ